MPRIVHEKAIEQAVKEVTEVYRGLIEIVRVPGDDPDKTAVLHSAVMLYACLPAESDEAALPTPNTTQGASSGTARRTGTQDGPQRTRSGAPSAYCDCVHRCWPSSYNAGDTGPRGCCACENCGCRGEAGYELVDISGEGERYPKWVWSETAERRQAMQDIRSNAHAQALGGDPADLPFE